MGMIQNLLSGISKDGREFKEKFKQAQEERRINRMLDEREKSANERELEDYMKRKREEGIKKQLDKIHNQQSSEMWKGTHSILEKEKSILRDNKPILKEKNIFELKSKQFGVPKRDSSGSGIRSNKGRGGCFPTQETGKGRMFFK